MGKSTDWGLEGDSERVVTRELAYRAYEKTAGEKGRET